VASGAVAVWPDVCEGAGPPGPTVIRVRPPRPGGPAERNRGRDGRGLTWLGGGAPVSSSSSWTKTGTQHLTPQAVVGLIHSHPYRTGRATGLREVTLSPHLALQLGVAMHPAYAS
jgi:hypothetical protein